MMRKSKGTARGGTSEDPFNIDELDRLLARMGAAIPEVAAEDDAIGAPEPPEAPPLEPDPDPRLGAALPEGPAARTGGLSADNHRHGRVLVEQLVGEGAVFAVDLGQPWAAAGAQIGLGCAPTALEGWLQVIQEGEGARVTGALAVRLPRSCDRCLAALELRLSGPVSLAYQPVTAEIEAPGETGLSADDLDIGWFEGPALELEQVISEQMALWLPDPVLCDEPGTARLRPEDGPCALPAAAGGPPGPRPSPFLGLASWKPPQ
jgi:uncharacterized metal-binding protein YceD (DUF177 family)